MKQRGYSLIETIIASFILLFGFVVAIRLFDAAINYGGISQMRGLAVTVANKKLEEIGYWNRTTHVPVGTTLFSDWTAYNGVTAPDPVNPTMTTTVVCAPVQNGVGDGFYSPCTTFESLYVTPPAPAIPPVLNNGPRQLNNCLEQVNVTVSWNRQTLTLTSLFAPPTGDYGTVHPSLTVAGTLGTPSGSSTVAPYGNAYFTATLTDVAGHTLDGVTFKWIIDGPGSGIISQTRDGHTCQFSNYYWSHKTKHVCTGESCIVEADAVYQGYLVQGYSGTLTL